MNELMITLLENDWLLYAACGAAGTGSLIQIILSVIYNRSLNASERMRNTKIAWLRQMKTRYESGYEWNNRIRNVELFVDKNIGRRKWMGIYLKTWEELAKMMLPLVLVFSILGAVCAGTYMEERTLALFYLVVGAALALSVRGVSTVANLKEKQKLLRTNLCEYFENTLQAEAKNRRREKLREPESYFGKQVLREELACAVTDDNGNMKSDGESQEENVDSKVQVTPEMPEVTEQSREITKQGKAVAKSNKKALLQEKKRDKQLEKIAKAETRRLKKQEKIEAKENAKLQRKQAKEQKRVDKLTKRMEKMQQRLGTAATVEGVGMTHTVGGRKEENARIKREQLKRKVDVTPAQEDQIISEVLREFLA